MVGPVDNKENPAYDRHQLSQRVRIIALCQKTKQNIYFLHDLKEKKNSG